MSIADALIAARAALDNLEREVDHALVAAHLPPIPLPMTVETVLLAVANESGLSVKQLLAPVRYRDVVRRRQIAMLLCYEMTVTSLWSLSRPFKRDHSTVWHGLQAAKKAVEDPYWRAFYDRCHKRLQPPRRVA